MFTTSLLAGLFVSASIIASNPLPNAQINTILGSSPESSIATEINIPMVPFYSQFSDIESKKWQKVGCGIASLAMLIEFYNPGVVSVNTLLEEGIAADAYLEDDGWTHNGLIFLAEKYGLKGERSNFANLDKNSAFDELAKALEKGPVMASVHYGFDPKSTIPHLVVINGVASTTVYYNDPAEKSGNGEISVEKFLKAWKKRYITIRLPEKEISGELALVK